MHPSLLDAMVSVFLDSLPNSTKAAHTSSAKVTLNGGLSTTQPRTERCSKRKRPPIAEAQTTQDNITEVCVSRIVPNALVLSVLALGKICLHKTRIPDLSLSSDICAQKNSPVLCDGDPGSSLSQNSPPEPPLVQTLSFSSLQDTIKSIAGYRTSPHSFDTASRSYNTERSYETVPGLEYFTLADEIIRSHVSGYTLQHVYTERILDSIVLECPMVSKWVHPDFQFEDSDEPAQDFLEARLRAKYWDFQVILYRKYIDAVLHDRYSSVVQQDGAVYYARLGIFALVQGTKAFHGLKKGQRIPVTNVFTTAHAQWGNLLVLSACYKHNVLQKYVEESTLQELFVRTIEFFKIIAHSGSALEKDLHILQEMYTIGNLPDKQKMTRSPIMDIFVCRPASTNATSSY
ncbi:putative Zn(2)-C6 fungal-type domain-containing protein [Seiridium cardinale]